MSKIKYRWKNKQLQIFRKHKWTESPREEHCKISAGFMREICKVHAPTNNLGLLRVSCECTSAVCSKKSQSGCAYIFANLCAKSANQSNRAAERRVVGKVTLLRFEYWL